MDCLKVLCFGLTVTMLVSKTTSTRITFFETADGNRSHQIFIPRQDACTTLPLPYFPQPTKSIRIHEGGDCVKIWESFQCQGKSRCFCEIDQIINLNDFMMTSQKSWGDTDIHSVSSCLYPEPTVATITLYNKEDFSGDNITLKLYQDKCETIFVDDKWRNKISSLSVVEGCVQCYTKENCEGQYETGWKNMTLEDPIVDGIRSMKPCPIDSDQDFETATRYEMLPIPLPETRATLNSLNSSCNHSYEYTSVNCSTYYACVNFSQKEYHHCSQEDGLAFNAGLGVCDLVGNVPECRDSQDVVSPSLTSQPLKNEACRSEYRPHMKDCRKFYYCQNVCSYPGDKGDCEERICPGGLLWSVDLYGDGSLHQQCTLPEKATCAATDPVVAFTCGKLADGNYRNERDCTTFWKCENGKTLLYNCPKGLIYDPQMDKCQLAGKAREHCQLDNEM